MNRKSFTKTLLASVVLGSVFVANIAKATEENPNVVQLDSALQNYTEANNFLDPKHASVEMSFDDITNNCNETYTDHKTQEEVTGVCYVGNMFDPKDGTKYLAEIEENKYKLKLKVPMSSIGYNAFVTGSSGNLIGNNDLRIYYDRESKTVDSLIIVSSSALGTAEGAGSIRISGVRSDIEEQEENRKGAAKEILRVVEQAAGGFVVDKINTVKTFAQEEAKREAEAVQSNLDTLAEEVATNKAKVEGASEKANSLSGELTTVKTGLANAQSTASDAAGAASLANSASSKNATDIVNLKESQQSTIAMATEAKNIASEAKSAVDTIDVTALLTRLDNINAELDKLKNRPVCKENESLSRGVDGVEFCKTMYLAKGVLEPKTGKIFENSFNIQKVEVASWGGTVITLDKPLPSNAVILITPRVISGVSSNLSVSYANSGDKISVLIHDSRGGHYYKGAKFSIKVE